MILRGEGFYNVDVDGDSLLVVSRGQKLIYDTLIAIVFKTW